MTEFDSDHAHDMYAPATAPTTGHEQRIREALEAGEAEDLLFADARTKDLRALLADLDAVRGALETERGRIVDLVEGRACHHNGPHLLTLELNQLASVIKSGMGWLEYERAKLKGATHD